MARGSLILPPRRDIAFVTIAVQLPASPWDSIGAWNSTRPRVDAAGAIHAEGSRRPSRRSSDGVDLDRTNGEILQNIAARRVKWWYRTSPPSKLPKSSHLYRHQWSSVSQTGSAGGQPAKVAFADAGHRSPAYWRTPCLKYRPVIPLDHRSDSAVSKAGGRRCRPRSSWREHSAHDIRVTIASSPALSVRYGGERVGWCATSRRRGSWRASSVPVGVAAAENWANWSPRRRDRKLVPLDSTHVIVQQLRRR